MTTNIYTQPITILRNVLLAPEEQNANNMWVRTIADFLNPQNQRLYAQTITAIRSMSQTIEDKNRNSDSVKKLKMSLPAAIISGVAEAGMTESHIKYRNGVIAIDIDAKENPALHDWESVKNTLSKSPYVAYAGLSVSGLGVFLLIPIADPQKHKEHFRAIDEDFKSATFAFMQQGDTEPTVLKGIVIDGAPSNISSKRFLSLDEKPYCNTNAEIYCKKSERPLPPPPQYESQKYKEGCRFDVEAFLNFHHISFNLRERHGGFQYIVECPWSHLHSSRSEAESTIFVDANGIPGYKCQHSHCSDKHWQDYRAFYDVEYRNRINQTRFPMVSDPERIRAMMGWNEPPKIIVPVRQSVIVEASPEGKSAGSQASRSQSHKCRLIYIPNYSYMMYMTEQEWDQTLSPQAVAAWQAANPVCPF